MPAESTTPGLVELTRRTFEAGSRHDLGNGVVFSRVRESGRLAGSEGRVQQERGWVLLWAEDVVTQATAYLDVDRARAAAERLAESRG
jgi:hypothetical protein